MNSRELEVVEGVEPIGTRDQMARRRVSRCHLHQSDDREQEQDRELYPEQRFLDIGRYLDPDVTDRRHDDDPRDADQQDPAAGCIRPDPVRIEEEEDVLTGDLGQACHDQDVGRNDPPPPEPACLRTKGTSRPSEGGAAVGVGVVHLLVAIGDEEHRNEGQDRDDRRLQAVDRDDHEPERGGQAVGRRGRGHPDYD